MGNPYGNQNYQTYGGGFGNYEDMYEEEEEENDPYAFEIDDRPKNKKDDSTKKYEERKKSLEKKRQVNTLKLGIQRKGRSKIKIRVITIRRFKKRDRTSKIKLK